MKKTGISGLVLIGKVMGATGLRLFLDPATREKVKTEFEMWQKKYSE